jgi:hypothetical protein
VCMELVGRSESHVKFDSHPIAGFDDHAPPQTLSCCRVQLIETRRTILYNVPRIFRRQYTRTQNWSLQFNIEERIFFSIQHNA